MDSHSHVHGDEGDDLWTPDTTMIDNGDVDDSVGQGGGSIGSTWIQPSLPLASASSATHSLASTGMMGTITSFQLPLNSLNAPLPHNTSHGIQPVLLAPNNPIIGMMRPPTPAPSPPATSLSSHTPPADSNASGSSVKESFESVQNDSMGNVTGTMDMIPGMREGMDVDSDEEEDSDKGWRSKSKRKGKVVERREDVTVLLDQFQRLPSSSRFAVLSALVDELRLDEALVVSRRIAPRLKRDILKDLPMELALHCLHFVEDPQTLASASRVSRYWYTILQDDSTWRSLCLRNRFASNYPSQRSPRPSPSTSRSYSLTQSANPLEAFGMSVPSTSLPSTPTKPDHSFIRPPIRLAELPQKNENVSFKQQFKSAYVTQSNWLRGGRILAVHLADDDTVVTSIAVDDKWLVMGMASSVIHLFHVATGRYVCTLSGHEAGVWALVLVSPNGGGQFPPKDTGEWHKTTVSKAYRPIDADDWNEESESEPDTSMDEENVESKKRKRRKFTFQRQSDPCGSARVWDTGPGAGKRYLVSGGCDRDIRVWDLKYGRCLHVLRGHTSTIRGIKVLEGRPLALTGSRDGTLRIWNIVEGICKNVLRGHTESVRCMEIAGNLVVSGSYDKTARVWDADTGECLHVLRGHYHQIYTCAFDGVRIATGSLDSSIRIWSAETGACVALLQGHTSLVGQLQLQGDRLVSGGSDGRVIIYDLSTYQCIHRLCAHDNSVTTLQMDDRWIISGGNDGRIKLFSVTTGKFIRELTLPCDAVWRMGFRDDRVFVMYARGGRTVLEMMTFVPGEEGVAPLMAFKGAQGA